MIQPKQPIVIALDGYSSCGKSSFAKTIAKELGYIYIDSGAMYRAITLFAMQNGLIRNGKADQYSLEKYLSELEIDFRYNSNSSQYETCLNGENVESKIRSMEVSENVSEVSKIKSVRQRLVALQRRMGEKKGIVMDGRDIGTVVFPNADIKIFMTATLEVRAQRRFLELKEKGLSVSLEEVKENLTQRDNIDQNRTESPLKKADDALILDNSNMTPAQQLEWFKKILEKHS
ncbi:MAG TPA: (d)CMP kinase [Bacteroidales bacterium]